MTKQIIHFNHDLLGDHPYIFDKPVDYVVANRLDEVKPALDRIEHYTKEGYYAVGYLSYEVAQAFNPKMETHEEVRLPYLYFGIYKDYLKLYEVPTGDLQKMNWVSDTTPKDYFKSIVHIHDAIQKGISYQVNYTIRLIAQYEQLNTRQLYEQLRQSQLANYTCHLQFNDFEIISVSPELFFAWDGYTIETKPMKGTIKRGNSSEEDKKLKDQLTHSEKDQAENVMIVDLLRNDLSRIAKKGTVNVPKLFDLEAYPTVYQMTSTVTAKTRDDVSLTSIFEAIFPCGSITGAPKISTMKLIKQLETSPREVYCGAIGMVTPERNAVFNVPIRTVLVDRRKQNAVYGVGGGITWDSTPEGEYEETVAKSNVLKQQGKDFELLETMKLSNGKIDYLDEHLNRLKRSAEFFKIPFEQSKLDEIIRRLLIEHTGTSYVVRLLLNRSGVFSYQVLPYEEPPYSVDVALAKKPIDKDNMFYYHKTTHREMYEIFQEDNVFDVLLWNESGNITEFTKGNVVYKLNGQLFTPPVSDGLLAGTFRERLITDNQVAERSLPKDELKYVDEIWFINSVRGWIRVNEVIT
ncbi:aminodeoxychorismate synthase component I [Piscibacillus halophilus]|uniref:aminodeoxychorismate synthase component I n=1 Tax=Piscibacillus halophilus TaxID=571933 RepID=UPI00158BB483|nr:aminodeoxychorismate synthase component I [Piscibacillus halophilus]